MLLFWKKNLRLFYCSVMPCLGRTQGGASVSL
uniref:Uncharacterized protein n=1 Tax=Anguilla anguilla TaxID=7936 RepID=A0A0E9PRL1_ANGAN